MQWSGHAGAAPLRGILWYQGESDAIGGRTKAQYIADLEQLVARYRSDLAAPDAVFLCVQLGTWSAGGYPNWTNIQEAQRQVCRADALAALATVHDQPRSDGIHYSVAGYQELGRRLAD
ncbi:MAG: sialate O-acetylesterase, partial [Planctomycetota bacterium]|nr:sialate O-acetylesterase [Planctomycetota bacterium]